MWSSTSIAWPGGRSIADGNAVHPGSLIVSVPANTRWSAVPVATSAVPVATITVPADAPPFRRAG